MMRRSWDGTNTTLNKYRWSYFRQLRQILKQHSVSSSYECHKLRAFQIKVKDNCLIAAATCSRASPVHSVIFVSFEVAGSSDFVSSDIKFNFNEDLWEFYCLKLKIYFWTSRRKKILRISSQQLMNLKFQNYSFTEWWEVLDCRCSNNFRSLEISK